MRIGMISQWYEPETGSAAHPTAIARALAGRGHDLRVLTSFPSYPTGRVHSGYTQRWRQHESRDGVTLMRVPDLPSHDDNGLRRATSLTSFAASATAQVGWLRGADVCLVYLTPATVGTAAMALRTLRGVPYVLYVQDLWPETVTASGFIANEKVTRLAERAISRYLSRLYGGASGIAAISPTMAGLIGTRGARVEPVSIPNWVDEELFRPADPAASGLADQLDPDRSWVMYAGGIGDVQGLEHAVRAIELLRHRSDIGLAVVGEGVARPGLEDQVRRAELGDRVRFLGSRPMEQMPSLMAGSTAQLVSLRALDLFRGTIPSKIQASMACGAPVLCSVAGDAAELVERSGCGITVPPEDAPALAAAMTRMVDLPGEDRDAMGRRGRQVYADELGAAAGAHRLELLLRDAVEKQR